MSGAGRTRGGASSAHGDTPSPPVPDGRRLSPAWRRLSPAWRRRLRAVQLAVGVWTTVALVEVVAAPSAAADNCSVFTDCFGVANSAVEAAFGLALLAALSMVLDFVPGVGTVKGVVEAATGRDLLTGQELAPWERALGVLPLVGGLVAVGGLSRAVRGASDVPTHVPHVPRTPRPPAGTRYPYSDPKVTTYRDPSTTPSQRGRLSEQIGEDGGLRYSRDVSGNADLPIVRPTSSGDVADLVARVDDGAAWDSVVAYNGRNATNLLYFDGDTLHIIEAKGGNGRYIDRQSTLQPGSRVSQTSPDYPLDVASDMSSSPLTDGRNEMGDLIERMYQEDRVRYVGVRTGPRGELVSGSPETVVEHVFKEPPP